MKFSLKRILTTSILLAFTASVFAAPLQDVSVTSVDLAENTFNARGDEHLFVTVTRVDDLLDDDGSLLAERVMAVKVTFDVVENQLMCNGQPVDIGVSSIQVEAQMTSNPEKLAITSEEDAAILADSFDLGLVTVEVTATVLDELKTDDGMVFRRMNVKELITEVNGQKVVQTEAGQQILDIFDNGSLIKWAVDPLTGFMLPGPALIEEQGRNNDVLTILDCPGCEDFRFEGWWNETSSVDQCLVGGALIAVFLSTLLALRQLFLSVANHRQYDAVLLEEEAQETSSEEVWDAKKQPPAYVEHDEKQSLVTEKDTN